jgi:putative transcriptional regulator
MEKLKAVRKDSHYTYNEMADFLNISKSYYWQLENGHRNLSYKMAVQIAEIFNMKPDDIFYEELKNKDC